MSLQESEKTWRPFDQTDYFNAKQAFKNMVAMKLMKKADMERNLQRLAEATRE